MPGVQLQVAEAVHVEDMSNERLPIPEGPGQIEPDQISRVNRISHRGQRLTGGEARGDGREDVAAVEGGRDRLEPERRAGDVDRLEDSRRPAPPPA